MYIAHIYSTYICVYMHIYMRTTCTAEFFPIVFFLKPNESFGCRRTAKWLVSAESLKWLWQVAAERRIGDGREQRSAAPSIVESADPRRSRLHLIKGQPLFVLVFYKLRLNAPNNEFNVMMFISKLCLWPEKFSVTPTDIMSNAPKSIFLLKSHKKVEPRTFKKKKEKKKFN